MKILLLSPDQRNRYNWGHQLFRDEIGKHHNVTYYGDGFPNFNSEIGVPKIIKKLGKPDIILTYGLRYTLPFKELSKITDIPKIHISVDYFPAMGNYKGNWEKQHNFFSERNYNLIFGVVGKVVRDLEANKVTKKSYLLPFAVDINQYRKLNIPKTIDVMASFTCRDDVYPNRGSIQKMVSKMGIKCLIKRVVHQKYIKSINASKIVVTSNNIFNSLSMKYTECLACGSFLLADKPEDFSELGYVDGKHLVLYKDLTDLKNKIRYFLNHEKEREQIAAEGMKFVRENHNVTIRAKQFTKIVNEVILGDKK